MPKRYQWCIKCACGTNKLAFKLPNGSEESDSERLEWAIRLDLMREMRLVDIQWIKSGRVCEDHFNAEDVIETKSGKRILKPGALPLSNYNEAQLDEIRSSFDSAYRSRRLMALKQSREVEEAHIMKCKSPNAETKAKKTKKKRRAASKRIAAKNELSTFVVIENEKRNSGGLSCSLRSVRRIKVPAVIESEDEVESEDLEPAAVESEDHESASVESEDLETAAVQSETQQMSSRFPHDYFAVASTSIVQRNNRTPNTSASIHCILCHSHSLESSCLLSRDALYRHILGHYLSLVKLVTDQRPMLEPLLHEIVSCVQCARWMTGVHQLLMHVVAEHDNRPLNQLMPKSRVEKMEPLLDFILHLLFGRHAQIVKEILVGCPTNKRRQSLKSPPPCSTVIIRRKSDLLDAGSKKTNERSIMNQADSSKCLVKSDCSKDLNRCSLAIETVKVEAFEFDDVDDTDSVPGPGAVPLFSAAKSDIADNDARSSGCLDIYSKRIKLETNNMSDMAVNAADLLASSSHFATDISLRFKEELVDE